MLDLVFVALTGLLFAIGAAYVVGCRALHQADRP